MSRAKAKRKKTYKPKYDYRLEMYGATIAPNDLARLRSLRREMTKEETATLAKPFAVFAEHLKQGRATEDQFQTMIDAGYNLLTLISVLLEKRTLAGTGETDLLIREEFVRIRQESMENLFRTVESIRKRHTATGKFGADSSDLAALDTLRSHWLNLLNLADYGDWFESYRRSQQDLLMMRHRAKRKETHEQGQ
ncbi:hypothetical protein V9W64_10545 [Neisseria leonii]|uniref:Uncharacterized protein n=1 Tax=Neisseria leonii TaxID=2995413 RepID=A0A9X4EA50_9NEIS|nr:hypothetical protein [Neisseria sp. 51.81]MDD9328238.1 hypothetical protein [Neisseria sp. 51.81]